MVVLPSCASEPISLDTEDDKVSVSQYEVNEKGHTFGSMEDSVIDEGSYEELFDSYPDLIEVVASNGKTGYVKKEDLIPAEQPSNPEEAVYAQEQIDKSIPVYNEDESSIIGYYDAQMGYAR